MNTKNNRNETMITGLLSVIALAAAVLGCSLPTANPTTNTAAPANTATTANSAAPANTSSNSSKATADNPATPFYGTWEGEFPGQPVSSLTFEKATDDKNGKYKGDITEGNIVAGNYTVGDDNKVSVYYKATDETYYLPYKFSDGGKTLTLQAKPPIEFTKGTSNTAIQDDVNALEGSNLSVNKSWIQGINRDMLLTFANASKSDEGWNGQYAKYDSTQGKDVDAGTYKITEAGKITFIPESGGSNSYTYEIDGNTLYLTRKGVKEVYIK